MTDIPTRRISINQVEYLDAKLKDVEDHKHILLDFGDQETIRRVFAEWKGDRRKEQAIKEREIK